MLQLPLESVLGTGLVLSLLSQELMEEQQHSLQPPRCCNINNFNSMFVEPL